VHSKNKESKGNLKLAFWGNGVVEIDFFKAEKAETNVSAFCLLWLRDKHEESNFLRFEIPIVLANNDKGAKHIVIDPFRLPYFLNLIESDVETLKQIGLMEKSELKTIPKPRINYSALATEYKQKIENGEFSN